MKNILMLVIAFLCIGYFFYSKYNIPGINNNIKHHSIFSSATATQELNYKVENDRIVLSDKDTRVAFIKTEPFNISGYVMGADHPSEGIFSVFAGTYGLVWGDTAIELATAPKEKMNDLSYFSPEARKVIQEQGCAAGYLNNHMVSFVAIAENAAIDKMLRDIKEGAIIDIKGYKVNIESANYKGASVDINVPGTVCITEVSVR